MRIFLRLNKYSALWNFIRELIYRLWYMNIERKCIWNILKSHSRFVMSFVSTATLWMHRTWILHPESFHAAPRLRTNICRTSVIQAECRIFFLCNTVKQQSCRTETLWRGYLMYWPESVRTFLLSPTRACICWEQWSCFLLRAVMAFSRSHLCASGGHSQCH